MSIMVFHSTCFLLTINIICQFLITRLQCSLNYFVFTSLPSRCVKNERWKEKYNVFVMSVGREGSVQGQSEKNNNFRGRERERESGGSRAWRTRSCKVIDMNEDQEDPVRVLHSLH
jgi:hypothetical protein